MTENFVLTGIASIIVGFNIYIGLYENVGKLNALNLACAGILATFTGGWHVS